MGNIIVLLHGTRTGSTGNLFASLAGTPTRQVARFDKGPELKAAKAGVRLGRLLLQGGLHLLLRDYFGAARLGACGPHTRRPFLVDGVDAKIMPTGYAKLVGTRHGPHFGVTVVFVADFAGALSFGRFDGLWVAAKVDAALLQQLVGIVVVDFQETFFGPIVLAQESGSGTGRNVQDLRDFFQAAVHFGGEVLRGHHANSGLGSYWRSHNNKQR